MQNLRTGIALFFLLLMPCFFAGRPASAQATATFEDLELSATGYWNGSDGSGRFTSGGIVFYNDYNAAWGSWSGFAVSNHTDPVTPGLANGYSSVTAGGVNGSRNYAVAYDYGNLRASFPRPSRITGTWVTNSTYACMAMRYGDAFSKRFGGPTGSDPDYFRLHIAGLDDKGDTTGVVTVYLADFRPENPLEDTILQCWKWVELESLELVSELRFSLESSDNGSWGMNTPAYFCLDNLNDTEKMATAIPDSYHRNNTVRESHSGFSLFPLPVGDHLTLECPRVPDRITITGMDGRVYVQERGGATGKVSLDNLAGLPAGLYLLVVEAGRERHSFLLPKR